MTKKAKKRAAPVKPEKTATRTPAPEQQTFQIDKLGQVITWHVPEAAYKGEINLRAAFIGGFRARAEQVNQDKMADGVPLRFAEGSKEQQAFADGYHDAARQDGRNITPKTLQGSSSKAAARRRGNG